MEQHREPTKLTSHWDEPLEYLDDITQLFSQRVKEFGVENLPVEDKVYNVSATRYNIHLLGSTKYSNGYVIDIQNISRHEKKFIWYIRDDLAVIQYKIVMVGVEVMYDLHARLEVTDLVGTAELAFPENLIDVDVFYNMITKEVGVSSMAMNSVRGPLTIYEPDSNVMRALAYNARLSMSSSLFSDLTIWINKTLRGLLKEIVQELPFPL